MDVTKRTSTDEGRTASTALLALTAAALSLQGIAVTPAQASNGGEISLEYSHFEEGARDLGSQSYRELNLRPIQDDSAALEFIGKVTDRATLTLNYTQDTWSGATPVVTVPEVAIQDQIYTGASRPSEYYSDGNHKPVAVNWDSYDGSTVKYTTDTRLVHVMASASPETRRQFDATVDYEGDTSTTTLGGGVSIEPDYESRFGSISEVIDFNDKTTTVSAGLSFTQSDIHASLEANAAADWGAYLDHIRDQNGVSTLFGSRRDLTLTLGVSQILSKRSLISSDVSFTRSSGYLSNPYKATVLAFDDPDQPIDSTQLRTVVLHGVLEQRPDFRTQFSWNTNFAQYIDSTAASWHVDYQFYHDSWGITAHTLDTAVYQPLGSDWMLVPGVRYYTQTKARFYQPYFLLNQPFPILFPRNPELPPQLDFSQLSLSEFSSDERLSTFGTFSGRLAINRRMGRGMVLELGAEYSLHAGALALQGKGEGSYADFTSFSVHAQLRIDQTVAAMFDEGVDNNASGDDPVLASADAIPAGVVVPRMLHKAGQFGIDYRYLSATSSGGIRNGRSATDDLTIVNSACGDVSCQLAPKQIYSNTQMIDLLFAPTSWLTVSLSPSLVDKHMSLRQLDTGFSNASGIFHPKTESLHQTTGGLGDTVLGVIVEALKSDSHTVKFELGLSVPTGSVGERRSGTSEYSTYALQLGTGTWDVLPALTYSGSFDRFWWGAQASGRLNLNSRNSSGYAAGHNYVLTAWGGMQLLDWLGISVRAGYDNEGGIMGQFKDHSVPELIGYNVVGTKVVPVYDYSLASQTVFGPMDLPSNYGGHGLNAALGLNANVPMGPLGISHLSAEWAPAIWRSYNGYQLSQEPTISVAWSVDL